MATYYIDFDGGVDDAGRDGLSEAQAWKTLEYITTRSAAAASNHYLLKAGTTRTGQFTITSAYNGTTNNPTYFGRYGDGPNPKIVSIPNNTSCLSISDRNWITLENIDCVGYSTQTSSGIGAGIYGSFGSGGLGITLRNINVSLTKATGIDLGFVNLDAPPTYGLRQVLIENCTMTKCGFHGMNIYGRADGVVVKNCIFKENGQITDGYGFSAVAAMATFSSSGWTNTTSTIYSRAITTPANYSGTVLDVINFALCNKNANSGNGYLFLTQNTSTPTTPAAGEYGFSAGTLYINAGANPTAISGFSCKAQYKPCSVTVVNCQSSANKQLSIEGAGFAADDMASVKFLRNISYDNEGGGFISHKNKNTVLVGNVVKNNAQFGIRLLGSDGTIVQNNTIVNNGPYGILGSGSADYSGNSNIYNNVITGHTTGIYSWNTKNTDNYNCLYNNTTNYADGIAAGGSTITTTPNYNVSFIPSSSGNLYHTGTYTKDYKDKQNTFFNNPPSMGAYESMSVRGSR